MSISTQFSNRGINTCVPFVSFNGVNHLNLPSLLQDIHVPDIGIGEPSIRAAPILATIAGTLSFTATLSLSTFLQSKLFHASTGTTKPIPSILGLGSVAISSLLAHFISIQTYVYSNQLSSSFHLDSDNSLFFINPSFSTSSFSSVHTVNPFFHDHNNANHHPFLQFLPDDLDISHTLHIIVLGLVAYKSLGGRFWSVAPSSYTHLGSFARSIRSLPATDAYATKVERKRICQLGRMYGCHTCGDRMIGRPGLKSGTKFVADHIPPRSVARQMNQRWYRRLIGRTVKQRFFPQCVNCSIKQSNILSEASKQLHKNMSYSKKMKLSGVWMKKVKIPNLAQSGGGTNAYVHGLRLRREHFAGGIIASATVCGDSDELDVVSGNRIRFREWHIQIEEFVKSVLGD